MSAGAAIKAGSAYVEIGARTGPLEAALRGMSGRLKRFGTELNEMGKGMVVAGLKLASPFMAAIKEGNSFERSMANVSTMLDEVGMSKMPAFTKGIREMSVEFGESTETLAKGLYDILSASVDPSKALDVLAVSSKAARAGLTDTGVAADAITTILNSYHLSASEAGSVSDLLFTTMKRGKTTFAELAPSIGMVASLASTAGLSLEEMSAMLSTMTRNGVRTEVAVTALNAVLSGIVKPTDEGAKLFKEKFGMALDTTTLKAEGLTGIMQKLGGASTEEIAKMFPNVRAIRGLLPALGDYAGYMTDIGLATNRTGMTEEAFQKQTQAIGFKIAQMWEQVKEVFLEVFFAIEGSVRSSIDAIMGALKAVQAWIAENPKLVESLFQIVRTVVLLGLALMTIGTAAKLIGALLSPFAFITTAVLILLDGVGLLDTGFRALVENIKVGGTTIGDHLTNVWLIAMEWWYKFEAVVFKGLGWLTEQFDKFVQTIVGGLNYLLEQFNATFGTELGAITVNFVTDLNTTLDKLAKGSAKEAQFAADARKELFKGQLTSLPDKGEVQSALDELGKKSAADMGVPPTLAASMAASDITMNTAAADRVFGTFSGAVAAGGQAGGGFEVFNRQLDAQKKTNDLLGTIEVNTRNSTGGFSE